nr:M20/M25/M40 family metallo-hydrolase [Acidiferrobacterales bacterium]
KVEHALDEINVNYQANWNLSGNPFVTDVAELVTACQQSIKEVLNIDTELSTSGGTSDGRFIAPTGAQVVELGPVNKSIHKIDECVALQAPAQLSKVYTQILRHLLT